MIWIGFQKEQKKEKKMLATRMCVDDADAPVKGLCSLCS